MQYNCKLRDLTITIRIKLSLQINESADITKVARSRIRFSASNNIIFAYTAAIRQIILISLEDCYEEIDFIST